MQSQLCHVPYGLLGKDNVNDINIDLALILSARDLDITPLSSTLVTNL